MVNRVRQESLVFSVGEIPTLERVKPAHQESSLELLKVTIGVKRRQSDSQAVSVKLKRLSAAKRMKPRADKFLFLEGYSRQPL